MPSQAQTAFAGSADPAQEDGTLSAPALHGRPESAVSQSTHYKKGPACLSSINHSRTTSRERSTTTVQQQPFSNGTPQRRQPPLNQRHLQWMPVQVKPALPA